MNEYQAQVYKFHLLDLLIHHEKLALHDILFLKWEDVKLINANIQLHLPDVTYQIRHQRTSDVIYNLQKEYNCSASSYIFLSSLRM